MEEVRWDWRIRQVVSGVEGVLPTVQRFALKQRVKHNSESFKGVRVKKVLFKGDCGVRAVKLYG